MTLSTPSARAAQALSRPFTLGGVTLANRIAMAPMTRGFAPGGVLHPAVAEYYRRRAEGGVGLIITEGTYVDHASAGLSGQVPYFHGEKALAAWARVADEVHQAGGRIMPQLWHVGMVRVQGAPPFPYAPAIGPSGIRNDGIRGGQAMTQNDIEAVVAAFADAAATAERLGFDGIELHGAHGYIIDEFLWSGTNHRTDPYGGDPASRARFAAEIVAACRQAVSADFPIIFRTSQWKMGDYGAKIADTPQELEALLTPLAEAGADAFHCSTRRYWLPEFDGSDLNMAGWAKKVTGKPSITVGSVGLDTDVFATDRGAQAAVTSIDRLIDRLERDEFDLVAVGRALLADAQWARKVLTQRTDTLIPFTPEAANTLR
ncbi:NADH:flavin oxidoreductase [Streptomyces sp. NPDC096310]|uniref:NADH:flavin oxidoreductase n=1 Tax=Streptomyces sp. NPDC096310 TaxID=3366082 RepID=UPI0038201517